MYRDKETIGEKVMEEEILQCGLDYLLNSCRLRKYTQEVRGKGRSMHRDA